jgi:hypothetical protein
MWHERASGLTNRSTRKHRLNGFSDLVLQVFGAEAGAHGRSAVGMAELRFGIPVAIEGEVELKAV